MLNAGTFLAVGKKTYIINIVGKAPFLQINSMLNMSDFEKGIVEQVSPEEELEFINNHTDYMMKSITEDKEDITKTHVEKVILTEIAFGEAERKKYCGMLQKLGKDKFIVKVSGEVGDVQKANLLLKKTINHLKECGFEDSVINRMGTMGDEQPD